MCNQILARIKMLSAKYACTKHIDLIYITLPSRGLSTLAMELTIATRVMQSSSNELITLVSDSAECK